MTDDVGIKALLTAAAFGGEAPSLHNSQPWRWRLGDHRLELMLERRRMLTATDPDGRLAVLSCGAALHHARIDLAAAGWHATVVRVAARELLATVTLRGPATPDHHARRLVRAAELRRTDRRDGPGAPLDHDKLRTIGAAIAAEGGTLTLLRPRQVFVLADAAERAQRIQRADAASQAELEQWIGDLRPPGAGIPASALPADPFQLTAPKLALRRAGTALVADTHHRAGTFGVLSTPGDGRIDWLRAGEALSAGWLTATVVKVSVLPLSAVVEVPTSRAMARHLIGWDGHPLLVLRFADGPDDPAGPRTPRLPVDRIVEYG
ncbi:Acg family FMN-binding oxidoreductase [Mangrovihabitans endophyticus]|uniref:NAD(P)H nitroreductase n=1 Tax=Mangrovihabitans endophyticus TaxID=1751298 RepID=A0A8J3BU95_9ACTN|nr:nitroreductase [Mangrovihabitans endophyticus]GGK75158.1 NAD(P)H nitroreductase [Mangrovihabitans endophyticus]